MRRVASAFLLVACQLGARPALAQSARPTTEASRDAGKHFQRGVALFNEADYAGALAEFKKAYEIAPNAAVLFNIGQTHFQLRSYASALSVFERYLADAGPNAEHRADAEANVETLRSRVGKIDVIAVDGAEVTIDDELAGKAPLPPLQAAVGRRKVTVFKDGAQQVRFVEVSAGETVRVEMKGAGVGSGVVGIPSRSEPRSSDGAPGARSSIVPLALWVGTGLLAAGAVTTGIVALGASSDLSDERKKPAGTTSRRQLDDLQSRTKGFALATDLLGGAAIITGGLAVYFTIKPPTQTGALPSPLRTGMRTGVRVGIGRVALEGSF